MTLFIAFDFHAAAGVLLMKPLRYSLDDQGAEWPVAVAGEFGRDGFVPRVPVKLELGSGFGRDGFVPRVPVLTEAEAVSFREQLERWEASLPGGKITGNQRFKTHLLLPLCARLVRHGDDTLSH